MDKLLHGISEKKMYKHLAYKNGTTCWIISETVDTHKTSCTSHSICFAILSTAPATRQYISLVLYILTLHALSTKLKGTTCPQLITLSYIIKKLEQNLHTLLRYKLHYRMIMKAGLHDSCIYICIMIIIGINMQRAIELPSKLSERVSTFQLVSFEDRSPWRMVLCNRRSERIISLSQLI